jgi:hypothetical protein
VPWSYAEFTPVRSAGVGYRTYASGGLDTDVFMMICGRFYRSNPPVFMAEVASGPGWYGPFHVNWQHPDFITKVRDAHWMALLCRHTMSICWSAPWAQIECRVPARCARQIDWNRFHRRRPVLAVRLDKISKAIMPSLAAWEKFLAARCLDYDYFWSNAPSSFQQADYPVLLEARAVPAEHLIPEKAREQRPLAVGAGRTVSLLVGTEPFQLLAFIRNSAEHQLGPGYGRGVREYHRRRRRVLPASVRFLHIPAGCQFKIYDVDAAACVRSGAAVANTTVDLGDTSHDFALLVTQFPLTPGW